MRAAFRVPKDRNRISSKAFNTVVSALRLYVEQRTGNQLLDNQSSGKRRHGRLRFERCKRLPISCVYFFIRSLKARDVWQLSLRPHRGCICGRHGVRRALSKPPLGAVGRLRTGRRNCFLASVRSGAFSLGCIPGCGPRVFRQPLCRAALISIRFS